MFNHIIKLYELENIEDRILTIDIITYNNELSEIYNLRNIYLEFNSNSNYKTAKTKLESMITLFSNHKIPCIC